MREGGQLNRNLGIDEPKIQFEQYPTTPHLAARMLYTADTVYDDIEDKAIGDFGSGCGILSIAANILGAGLVVLVKFMLLFDILSMAHDIDTALGLILIQMPSRLHKRIARHLKWTLIL